MKCKNCGHDIYYTGSVLRHVGIRGRHWKGLEEVLCSCKKPQGEKGDGIRTEGSLTSDESSNGRATPSPRNPGSLTERCENCQQYLGDTPWEHKCKNQAEKKKK